MVGAVVAVDGTNNMTVTGVDGRFSLPGVSGEVTLSVSLVGFNAFERTVAADITRVEVALSEVTALDAVVVTGYSAQRKATLVGAVSSVSGNDIVATKNENVINSLAGKLPGLRITQTTSRPGALGAGVQFDIRGLGDPLIVIDGVPSSKDAFASIDAGDIESVNILKDGSAAIYGLRSANGVVLVTTKRGTEGRSEIKYSTNIAWQSFLHVPDNVDAAQFMELANEKEYAQNWYNTIRGVTEPKFTAAEMEPYLNGTKKSTDWMGAIFKKSPMQHQHNLTFSGGNANVRYYTNVSYQKQNSALRSNSINYDRWNFRSNMDAQISKRIKASVSISGYKDKLVEPAGGTWELYKSSFLQLPHVPIYANDNPLYLNAGYAEQYNAILDIHPLMRADSKYFGEQQRVRRSLNGQFELSYDVPGVEGLVARALYNYRFDNNTNQSYMQPAFAYLYDEVNDAYIAGVPVAGREGRRSARMSDSKTEVTQLRLQLNYNRVFGDHRVSAVALFEEQYGKGEGLWAQRFLTMPVNHLFAGDTNRQEGVGDAPWDDATQAFAGDFNYDYKGKYLLNANVRYDGTSKFPEDSRWGLFGSVGVGWRISEEAFFKESPLSFIDNLKLRALWGHLGDDSGFSRYPQLSAAYGLNGNVGWIYSGGVYSQGVLPTTLPNPYLTWITANSVNLGVDIELWNGLLGGSFEYYVRKRDGMMAQSTVQLPGTVGATMPQDNLNADRQFGYDMEIYHRNRINDFSYSVSANMFTTRREWTKHMMDVPNSSYANYKEEDNIDRYQNIWWVRKTLGQFQSWDQIFNFTDYNLGSGAGQTPGNYYHEDWNKDGVINDEDQQALANNGMALFNYGINLDAAWKGIDLSIGFQGAARLYYRYQETYAMPLSFDGGTNSKFMDRWHPVDPARMFDPTAEWIPGKFQVTKHQAIDENGSMSIENASYLRLKSLTIGYTIPERIVSKWGIKALRVYASGYNLLTFTGLEGMDPEHPGGQGGASSDNATFNGPYTYPINRTLNLGASITF